MYIFNKLVFVVFVVILYSCDDTSIQQEIQIPKVKIVYDDSVLQLGCTFSEFEEINSNIQKLTNYISLQNGFCDEFSHYRFLNPMDSISDIYKTYIFFNDVLVGLHYQKPYKLLMKDSVTVGINDNVNKLVLNSLLLEPYVVESRGLTLKLQIDETISENLIFEVYNSELRKDNLNCW